MHFIDFVFLSTYQFYKKKEVVYLYSLCGILVLLGGCKSTTTTRGLATQNIPSWVKTKPISNVFYVGLGHASKTYVDNYIQHAKKNALEDIASEIQVNITSSSILYMIDLDKKFHEKYEQIIHTTTSNELQEYEQISSWEDDENYWVYYRLSKKRYHEIKETQKKNAVEQALNFFTKAKQYEHDKKNVQAIAFYFKGMSAIEKYLIHPLHIEYKGKKIFLANEIYASIQRILDNIQLSIPFKVIILNRRIVKNRKDIIVHAIYKNTKDPIVTLPLIATFEKGDGDMLHHYTTDMTGQNKILITKINSKEKEQQINIKVDLQNFAGQNPTKIYTLITNKIIVPQVNILLKVEPPIVYTTSIEKDMGHDRINKPITNRIKNYLTNSGFVLTNNKDKAELWLDIKINSKKGSSSGSIYSAYATIILKIVDLYKEKEIYTVTLDRIKDYSLDYKRASQAAYNQATKELEKTTLPKLINAILQ